MGIASSSLRIPIALSGLRKIRPSAKRCGSGGDTRPSCPTNSMTRLLGVSGSGGRLLLHTSRVDFSVPIVYALGNEVQVLTPPPCVDSRSSAFWKFTVEKV